MLFLHGLINEKYWDLMHRGIFPFTMGTNTYITKRKMIIVFIIMLPMVTIPTRCPIIAPETASPTRKRDPGGIRTDWWVYIRTCGSCVE